LNGVVGFDQKRVMSEDDGEAPAPIFLDISPDAKPIEMESLCMLCFQNGTTRMLLTKIPFFREVMISHFECPHCGYSDQRAQFAGEFPNKGVHFELDVASASDLNRRVVKSCHGVVKVPELDFEIPGPTQADTITTVEGILTRAYEGLQSAEKTPQLDEFLENLDMCVKGLVQFKFILDDPSGNSFVENPIAPKPDPCMRVEFYKRTPQQMEAVGLVNDPKRGNFDIDDSEHINSVFADDSRVLTFETPCSVCSTEGTVKSCTLNIPHFKEIVIISFHCESCGYRNGEVMVGGEVSACARKITLHCTNERDLTRELLKSETASVKIPECGLDLLPGTLGGKFSTVEGLVDDIIKSLEERNPFARGGDSSESPNEVFLTLISELKTYKSGVKRFTMVMDDALANSYIQALDGDEEGKIVIEDYERTFEQNEAIGINDMRTEEVVNSEGKAEYAQPV
jgi:zinc finger protein